MAPLAWPDDNTLLAITGFDEHMLTLYNRTMDGDLALSQTLTGGDAGILHLVNPQAVRFFPGAAYPYIACAGSHALVVLNRVETKSGATKYTLFQTLTDEEVDGGLKGAGSLAVAADGKRLFVAGEADSGVLVFRKQQDGRLRRESKFYDNEPAGADTDSKVQATALEGISSLQLSKDGQFLLVTSAKQDLLSAA